MLGMTLALRLRQQGHRPTIFEGAPATGGLAAPQEIGGFTWDRFYHVILASDANLLGLLAELGLRERVRWGTTRTGFYVDGRLYSLSSSLDFLMFPPLSLLDKARLAFTVLHASRIRDWRPLEAIPATEWLRRLSGRRTVERIWRPLLESKLGPNAPLASAAFIWAVIARLYAARRSGLKREQFGYVDGGYDPVLAAFRDRLARDGVTLHAAAPVARVEAVDGATGARVTLRDGAAHDFDDVVLTLPASRIGALCPGLAPAERERLARVVYQGVICASLLLQRPLAGFYVTNITDAGIPFTGIIEMTALVDRARFGGHALVYLPRYLAQGDAYWGATDADVERDFLAGLARIHPALRPDDVLAFRVARAREVQALSTLHYTERARPPLRTSIPGVFIVNSAQIANGTLNVNETVGLANTAAAELAPLFAAPAAAIHD